jgi:hypothetical protein
MNNEDIIREIRRPRTMEEWKYRHLYSVRPRFILLAFGFMATLLLFSACCPDKPSDIAKEHSIKAEEKKVMTKYFAGISEAQKNFRYRDSKPKPKPAQTESY